MIGKPKIDERSEQHYVGIRVQIKMEDFPKAIDKAFSQLFSWLKEKHIPQAGPALIRYHVINMEDKLDVEMAVPVENPIKGEGEISSGMLPSGRYASLLYTGHYDGLMEATRFIVEWAKAEGIEWDAWDSETGHAFRSRYETYFTDPSEEPDPSKWETEIAIKLAD